jgi:hypothetical protein
MVQTGALPGFSISIIRQQTFVEAGQPLTVSGRVSGFGLGLPAFVRVTLSGPAHAPEQRNFDTIASPLGDYAVQVMAEKDGMYSVKARAGPEPLFLGPSFLESAEPPIAIGRPSNGRLEQHVNGRVERVAPPQPNRIEVGAPVISFAPTISLPSPGAAEPRLLPAAPGPAPVAPPQVPGAPPPPTAVRGARITGVEFE